jgi:hypothetical protein
MHSGGEDQTRGASLIVPFFFISKLRLPLVDDASYTEGRRNLQGEKRNFNN